MDAVTADDFRRHYAILSDDALLEIDTGELVPVARACHAEELAQRGLAHGSLSGGDGAGASSEPDSVKPEEDELVCIVEYDYHDEADLARGLLEAAEIPASLESEPGVVRLMVPSSLSAHALEMLASPLSDEELAAQAEAAGLDGDEAE
jgi:hypothetical protein